MGFFVTVALLIGLGFLVIKFLTAGAGSERFRIDGSGTFDTEVVGESHYQDALERICGGRSADGAQHRCEAELVPEDSNPYDGNAVRVDVDGRTVGYLPRASAKKYRAALRQRKLNGGVGVAQAEIRGGWKRRDDVGSFGIWLDL